MLIKVNLIQTIFDALLSKKRTISYHRKTDGSTQFPISLRPVPFNICDRGDRDGSYETPLCIFVW